MKNSIWFVIACACGVLFCGCPRVAEFELPVINLSKVSDEEIIAGILDDVQRGIESRRIFTVLAHVSKDYHDQEGRDYAAIQAYLKNLFREYRDIRVTRTRPRIVVQGLRAKAFETFGTQAKPVNPTTGRPIDLQGHVTVFLEKTGGRWQIIEWGPIH